MRTIVLQWFSISGLAAGYGGSRDALARQLSEPPFKWGDATPDHQMWQVVKPFDATGGVVLENPVLDLEVRGAGLSERERPGGVGALCFYPCGPLFMTLQSAHGQ